MSTSTARSYVAHQSRQWQDLLLPGGPVRPVRYRIGPDGSGLSEADQGELARGPGVAGQVKVLGGTYWAATGSFVFFLTESYVEFSLHTNTVVASHPLGLVEQFPGPPPGQYLAECLARTRAAARSTRSTVPNMSRSTFGPGPSPRAIQADRGNWIGLIDGSWVGPIALSTTAHPQTLLSLGHFAKQGFDHDEFIGCRGIRAARGTRRITRAREALPATRTAMDPWVRPTPPAAVPASARISMGARSVSGPSPTSPPPPGFLQADARRRLCQP